ncbi:MAG TPA: M28 family peptidase [Bacteroidales bacterium]|nr:M28 family peptidase [Bacteroidales bacterium]
MENKLCTIVSVCLLLMISSCITDRRPHQNEIILTRAEVTADLRFLASDELRGRKAGSEEAFITSRFIAEQFRSAGVRSFPATKGYFQTVPVGLTKTGFRRINKSSPANCRNVVGYIEGSDPLLKNEYVVLVAHFDHLGVKTRVSSTEVDSVFNGARDNGIGTVTLLSAVKVLASEPPARPVIFLATTGEEEGMIGSRYFTENCPVSRRHIVFVLNSDGGGYNDTSLVRIGGLSKVKIGNSIITGLNQIGLKCLPYPPELEYLSEEQSDCLPFLQSGIPSVTFSPGFNRIDEEITRYIHTTKDKADDNFNYSYLLKLCIAYIAAARIIANAK